MRRSSQEKRLFWLDKINEQRVSGFSVKDYCEKKGLSVATYYWWKRRLLSIDGVNVANERSHALFEKSLFAKVVMESDDLSVSRESEDDRYELTVAGRYCLRFGARPHKETIQTVLMAIEDL